jgi:hypothetical protein
MTDDPIEPPSPASDFPLLIQRMSIFAATPNCRGTSLAWLTSPADEIGDSRRQERAQFSEFV